MSEVQSFPYKCTYCGRSGKYRASSIGLALDYRCPHDGARLIVQEPATPFTETVSVGAETQEVLEFTHKLSATIINKLRVPGL